MHSEADFDEKKVSSNEAGTDRKSLENEWCLIREALQRRLSKDAFHRWFRSAMPGGIEGEELLLLVPNEIHQVWIETNYMPELVASVGEADCGAHGVRLVVDPSVAIDPVDGKAADVPRRTEWKPEPPVTARDDMGRRMKQASLNPVLTFERFVVGANNQFAHAAGQAVATGSGPGFNPLFIHGGSGLGKTHLMQAIGQSWLREREKVKVIYLTCERFTNEFIDAVRKGDIERFRRRYRNVELMLIDDVQFLAGKERSGEEFFHTFNTLLDGHKQIVLTSDRPACEIKSLEPRLVSRFECGLTVELQRPQMETRLAILQRKMGEWKVTVDDEIRVATYSSLAGQSVSLEKVEHLLRDLLREEATRQVTIDSIQRAVADHFDLRLADMTSRRRPANIAFPRQVAMYLSRQMTKGSLVEIGEAFGGRDHGTVIHACRKVNERMDTEPSLRETVGLLESVLQR